ncbi:MAG: 5-(carboxyamino)imidazole ribonucleotide mutase [Patescibacteria group bacterium]
MQQISVAIIMGSISDEKKMKDCKDVLDEFGVPCEYTVASAHRTPEKTRNFVRSRETNGCKVFICGAGAAAHLAGAVAAITTKPVIGVPLSGSSSTGINGLDALFSTVQMPSGIPVATVALDGAKNAAHLAIEILAIGDEDLHHKLEKARAIMAQKVSDADAELHEKWGKGK